MSTIKTVPLGTQGLHVPVEGLGCMGMTGGINGMSVYGEADEVESLATLHRALELGVTMLDTADLYGPMKNERLVAKVLAGQRDKFTVATKFGFEVDDRPDPGLSGRLGRRLIEPVDAADPGVWRGELRTDS